MDRGLITINPANGVATFIGLVPKIGALAFDNLGNLYGQTQPGEDDIPERLVRIDKTDGSFEVVCGMPLGDGRALGFNPLNNLLYQETTHFSGNTVSLLYKFDPSTLVCPTIIPVTQELDEEFEPRALTYSPF